jgi:hypothetical protein
MRYNCANRVEKYLYFRMFMPLLVNKKGIEVNSLKKLPEGIITYHLEIQWYT